MKTVVGIHQPDFFPWLGFFNKYRKSDTFVILDHTENNPRDSNFWGRRVKILANGQPFWLSVPLTKPSGKLGQPILEMTLNINDRKFKKKNLSTLSQSYSKAHHFDQIFPLVEAYFNHESTSLIERNMGFILEVGGQLGFNTEMVYSSDLNCQMSSTDLLIEIIQKVGGTDYLSGTGADGYMKDEMFGQNGIGLQFNEFSFIPYDQFNAKEFVPGLSILDALMNLGFEGVKGLFSKMDQQSDEN